MERYKTGISREQINIELLDFESLITETNPVRAIDAMVNRMDMREIGFVYGETKETGRMPYNPGDMLKMYFYAYSNGICSSRKIERECSRNIELMWLIKRLEPDFKTIADFRKNNKEAIQKTFVKFSMICDELGLLGKEIVAEDGSKFRASNNSNKYWTKKKVENKREEYRKSAEKYVKLLDDCDKKEENNRKAKKYTRDELEKRLEIIERKIENLEEIAVLVEEADGDVSITDADARKMKHLNGANEISHNVQIAVDDKNHMVVAVDVTSDAVDYEQFNNISIQAKENLGVETLTAIADKGYFSAEELAKAEQNGIIPIVDSAEKTSAPDPEYAKSNFFYDEENDVYICPQGRRLPRKVKRSKDKKETDYGSRQVCENCPVREKCTNSKDGRYIRRGEFEAAADRSIARVYADRSLYKKRMCLVEHIFGTIKAGFGFRQLTVRGTAMVRTEMSLCFLAYNLKRAINVLGVPAVSVAG
jgi:transposase